MNSHLRPSRRNEVHRRPIAARAPHPGTALIVALVCLTISGMATVAIVRLAFTEQKLADHELRTVQAAWLAESALDRAVARRRADAGYAGEVWSPSLGRDQDQTRVEIVVGRTDDDAPLVTAVADDRDDADDRIRARRTMRW